MPAHGEQAAAPGETGHAPPRRRAGRRRAARRPSRSRTRRRRPPRRPHSLLRGRRGRRRSSSSSPTRGTSSRTSAARAARAHRAAARSARCRRRRPPRPGSSRGTNRNASTTTPMRPRGKCTRTPTAGRRRAGGDTGAREQPEAPRAVQSRQHRPLPNRRSTATPCAFAATSTMPNPAPSRHAAGTSERERRRERGGVMPPAVDEEAERDRARGCRGATRASRRAAASRWPRARRRRWRCPSRPLSS